MSQWQLAAEEINLDFIFLGLHLGHYRKEYYYCSQNNFQAPIMSNDCV